jgi:puromycin-sensitive aminopeptidase
MFDVLTYEKGAGVLRMLEQFLGPDVFRNGIRRYLNTHAYKNADTGDLWIALGQAAKQPIPDLMDGWIFQPGYPLITVAREGAELRLTQQRFTYLSNPEPRTSNPTPATWQVPIQLRFITGRQSRTHRLLLTDRTATIPIPGDMDSVVVNEGGHGFYRVRYERELLACLTPHLDRLTPIERFNLVNDTWASTVAGLSPLADYLDLTARFKSERNRDVWTILLGSFHQLHRIVEEVARPKWETFLQDRIEPALSEIGWSPKPGEDDLTKQLRGDLIRAMGTIGNDRSVRDHAAALYDEHEHGHAMIDANVLPALIGILAHVGDQARYDDFVRRFQTAATPQEERRYLYALAAFQQPALLERTLAKTVTGEFRMQDAPFLVRLVLMNLVGGELAWDFVKANWDTMDRLYPKQGLRRMCEGIVGLATPELERDVHRFFDERTIDLGGKTLAQYLEQLHIAVRFREREQESLTRYLVA